MWIYSKVSFIPVYFQHQSSVSHDPPEITRIWWSDAQETFMIIINVENIFISGLFDEQKVQKNSIDLK